MADGVLTRLAQLFEFAKELAEIRKRHRIYEPYGEYDGPRVVTIIDFYKDAYVVKYHRMIAIVKAADPADLKFWIEPLSGKVEDVLSTEEAVAIEIEMRQLLERAGCPPPVRQAMVALAVPIRDVICHHLAIYLPPK